MVNDLLQNFIQFAKEEYNCEVTIKESDKSEPFEEIFGHSFLKRKDTNMRYRTKMREISAFQYTGLIKDKDGNYYIPDWAIPYYEDSTLELGVSPTSNDYPILYVGENYVAHIFDYVVLLDGNLTVMKPADFVDTYEPVEDEDE